MSFKVKVATHYTGLMGGVLRSKRPTRKARTRCSICGTTVRRVIKMSRKNVCHSCFDRIYSKRGDFKNLSDGVIRFSPKKYSLKAA